jgi:hypothetical protein
MTQEEYVMKLEQQVSPELVADLKDWPTETKMYLYIHNIQLAHMARFEKLLTQIIFEQRI